MPDENGRRICLRCGMTGNVDPWEHEERYGHKPVIEKDGQAFEHDGRGTFTTALETY